LRAALRRTLRWAPRPGDVSLSAILER
jgi:hypothetical protein